MTKKNRFRTKYTSMGGNPRLSSTEMGNAPESEPERNIRRLGDTMRVWLGLHHVSGFWTYRSLLGLSSGMSSRIFDRDKSSCMSLTACTTLKTIVHPPVHVADSTDVLLWWSLWFRPVAIWKNKDLSKNMVLQCSHAVSYCCLCLSSPLMKRSSGLLAMWILILILWQCWLTVPARKCMVSDRI